MYVKYYCRYIIYLLGACGQNDLFSLPVPHALAGRRYVTCRLPPPSSLLGTMHGRFCLWQWQHILPICLWSCLALVKSNVPRLGASVVPCRLILYRTFLCPRHYRMGYGFDSPPSASGEGLFGSYHSSILVLLTHSLLQCYTPFLPAPPTPDYAVPYTVSIWYASRGPGEGIRFGFGYSFLASF